MKVVVDHEICQTHAQCVLAAPEVFSLVEGELVYKTAPHESLRDKVENAEEICPMGAIRIED
jgi:ferredoxin